MMKGNHHHHGTPNRRREQLLAGWKWGSSWEGDEEEGSKMEP